MNDKLDKILDLLRKDIIIINNNEDSKTYELQDIYIHDPDIQESRSYT